MTAIPADRIASIWAGSAAASVITSSTSSRSQIRAKATLPIFELSAATMTWRAR